MNSLDVSVDASGEWLCNHVDAAGNPAAPAPLKLDRAEVLVTNPLGKPPRKSIWCSTCGTYWRVWLEHVVARPCIQWTPRMRSSPPEFRRAPLVDVDRIIFATLERVPSLIVQQYQQPFLADDEGVWWFSIPELPQNIQLESSNGMCPFIVEDSSTGDSTLATIASTVEEATERVVAYLQSLQDERQGQR